MESSTSRHAKWAQIDKENFEMFTRSGRTEDSKDFLCCTIS